MNTLFAIVLAVLTTTSATPDDTYEVKKLLCFDLPVQVEHKQDDSETVLMRVTAYAPFDNVSGICADEDPTVTSIGHRPGVQYAAVDPSRIPYGTPMVVPGYGVVEAGDTGGALRNCKDLAIDVYFDTHEEAMAWGVQYLEVTILY